MADETAAEDAQEALDNDQTRLYNQLGRSLGGTIYFRERNMRFVGRRALETYEEMRRTDAQVRATLRLVKAPIISAQWYVEPASPSERDKEIADFVEWNRTRMSRTWKQVLWEALLMLDYGWMGLEKVYETVEWRTPDAERGPRRKVVAWRKLAPLHPIQLDHFEYDAGGGVQAIHFDFQEPQTQKSFKRRITIDKLLLFVFDEEGGNPEGISILRSAWPHYYFKTNLYKIDAIQKERHGIGIPQIELPPSANAKDKQLATEMARNLRTNEKAEIVHPAGWIVKFAQLQGEPVDVLRSAEHHDLMIARNLLVQFLNLGTSESGSRAIGNSMADVFFKALRYVADLVSEVFNQYTIPQLVDYNYSVDAYPRLKVRKIGEEADYRAFSVAYRNAVEAGGITPTPEDENWMRDWMDMPRAPKAALDRGADARVRTKGSQGGAGPPEASPSAPQEPASPADTSNRVPKPSGG